MKQCLISVVVVFLASMLLDFAVHGGQPLGLTLVVKPIVLGGIATVLLGLVAAALNKLTA